MLGIIIVGVLVVLRLMMGQRIYNQFIAQWLFHISKALLLLPFKMIKYAIELLRLAGKYIK